MSRPEAASVPVPEHDEGDHLLGEQEDEYGDEEADYEQFRQWMQFRERGRRREQRGPRSRDQSRRGREDEDDDNGDLRANAGPPPPWDGQESPFEDYLIRARIWVGTTKARGRTRGPLLLKALSGTPFQDFKHLAKDTKWLTDPDNAETLLSQMDTPEYYGDDKDEHLLASLSRITYHLKRSRNESARQFLGRWEAAERKVLEHKVNLPSIYKGFLLINALGLSEADTKALLNFTQGSIEPKDVKHWLRKHETKLQANQLGNEVSTKLGKPTGTAIHLVEDQSEENTEVAPEGAEETELEMMEAMLADLVEPEEPETGPFEEQEAAEILAMMIKEKKKTYSQSAQLKKDKELGRGYRSGGGFNRANNGPIRPGTYKLSIAELKQRTRCQKCGRIGHWKRECPGTASASSTMPPKETHLLEVDLQDYDDAMFCHLLETIPEKITSTNAVLTEEFEPKGCGEHPDRTDSPISELDYMSCRFHEVWFSDHTGYDDRACATLDTGCQRTAVGIETLNQMKPLWPHELKWFKQEETNRFRSVHGVSQTTYNAVLPCSLGKKGCYLKPAVFEGPQSSQAPFLLSLKFLLQSDAIISLVQGRLMLVLSKHGAHIPLHLGPTGALRVQLNDFSRVMLSALRKAEGRLHSSGSNEFDILALGELKDPPRERELSVVNQVASNTPPRSHGLLVANEQEGSSGGVGWSSHGPGIGCLEESSPPPVRHLPARGAHDGEPGGRIFGPLVPASEEQRPCLPPRQLGGAPSGGGRSDQGQERPRQGALPQVPELETREEGEGGDANRVRVRDGGQTGAQQCTVMAGLHLGLHALQHQDREPGKKDDVVYGGRDLRQAQLTAGTATTDTGEEKQDDDNYKRGIEPLSGPEFKLDTRDREGDGQDEAAGDLHLRGPALRHRVTGLPVQSGLQDGAQTNLGQLPEGVYKLLPSDREGAVRRVPMVQQAAATGRRVSCHPREDPGRAQGGPHAPGVPGADDSGSMRTQLDRSDGIQCLRESRALPHMQQAAHRREQEPQEGDYDLDGQIRNSTDGSLGRKHQPQRGLPGVSGLAPSAALSRRQCRQLRGSMSRTHRSMATTFELLQLGSTAIPSNNDDTHRRFSASENRTYREMLACSLLDRSDARDLCEPDKLGCDMSVLRVPEDVSSFLSLLCQTLKLQSTCLVLIMPDNLHKLENADALCRIAEQGSTRACRQGCRVVCLWQQGPRGCRGNRLETVEGSILTERSLFGNMQCATSWPPFARALQKGQCLTLLAALALLRCLLANAFGIPDDQVYERDVVGNDQEHQDQIRRYQEQLQQPLTEQEIYFQRRVRARRGDREDDQDGAGDQDMNREHAGDSEQQPVPDSAEGGGDQDEGPPGIPAEADSVHREPHQADDSGQQPVPDSAEGEGDQVHVNRGQEEKDLPGSQQRTLRQLVRRAHDGLGHPHRERFIRILRAAKASPEVIKLAQDLKCSVCEKFLQTRPPRRAAPPREFDVNEVIGMDTVWLPTVGQKRKRIALNIIDYATHFQMMIPLKGRSPEAVWTAYRQWVKFFGPPKQIWADQGGEFKGSSRTRTIQEGTRMDPSSLESPFQRGLAERHGKTFKVILEKAMTDYNCSSLAEWHEMVDMAVMMKNRLASRGGFSPVQRVIGYLPRLPGGLLSGGQNDAEAGKPNRLGDGGLARAMAMRRAAAKAFFEVDCDQALRNVLAGGPRPQHDYVVGQMVYFYRLGHSKKGDRPHERWHGPARVIMTDLPTTMWLSYQENLVKASPERIRPGSEEEQLTISGWLDGLAQAKEEFEKAPKRGYLDLTNEPLPEMDELDDPEDQAEPIEDYEFAPPEPVLRRVRRKTNVEGLQASRGPLMTEEPLPRSEVDNSNTLPPLVGDGQWEPLPDERPGPDDEDLIMEDQDAGDAEPPAKRSRLQLLETYYAKLETLFKTRQRKEVKLKDLSAEDLACFLRATEKEIKNNMETKAYEQLSSEESYKIRQTCPERIMESRYVRTAKPLEHDDVDKAQCDGTLLKGDHGGPCKAKVRHVMKGFSEEGAEDLESATPQVTREGVMFTAQVIASKGWQVGFLDFTQAFHSGDPIGRELYAEQPPEGVPGMKKGDLLKLLKTCYGLLDGPIAWFRHLKRVLLQELGYVQSLADPCIYFLHDEGKGGWDRLVGIVSVATDDLLHGGNEVHQEKMKILNSKYKLGKFQYGAGRFTGKQFTPQPDGSIVVDQKHYVTEKVHKIPLSKARKLQRYSYCTDQEIGLLRSLIGALSWLAKETRPDLCGRISLLQQQFPRPRIRDIIIANQLASEAERYQIGIRIAPIPVDRLRVSAVTDAAWGNAEGPGKKESGQDFWVETSTQWIRKHVQPRRTLFHPGMVDSGPDLHQISPERVTYMVQDGQEHKQSDQWNSGKISVINGDSWTGQTVFCKCEKGLGHAEISEQFLQNRRTSSQGGHLIIFHDQDLQFEPSSSVTISSWKSYRLKRKVVNTLSAECQALASGIGNVHWHRFLLLEAQGAEKIDQDWERTLSCIPYLAVTDSKSLYDSLSKQTCPYSQIDDKRTAIDISIIKNELSQGGTVRWIDGRNMISDSLTKNVGSGYLRHVMTQGRWTLNELGFNDRRQVTMQAAFSSMMVYGANGFSQNKVVPM